MDAQICFLNKHNTKNNTFRPHSHDCYEVVYFLKGEGNAVINNETYPIAANSYYFIPPDTSHVESIDGYGEILFIGFEYKNFSDKYNFKTGIYDCGNIEKLSLLSRILEEYKNQDEDFKTAAALLLELFLIEANRANVAKNSNCKNLDYIQTYIEHHFEQKINMSELSELCGYSYDYFRCIFKRKFGVSPQKYILNTRINNALKMLKETNLSCTEIAYSCGFSNAAQMSMMLRKECGCSPTAIRNNRLV